MDVWMLAFFSSLETLEYKYKGGIFIIIIIIAQKKKNSSQAWADADKKKKNKKKKKRRPQFAKWLQSQNALQPKSCMILSSKSSWVNY